jgi:hypothetical protein
MIARIGQLSPGFHLGIGIILDAQFIFKEFEYVLIHHQVFVVISWIATAHEE